MASNYVVLDYTFIINPSETWAHLNEFETAFGKFLAERGMEGQFLNTLNGATGRKIVLIKKSSTTTPLVNTNADANASGIPPNPVGRPLSLKSHIASLAPNTERAVAKHYRKGKFLKSKGYLKKG